MQTLRLVIGWPRNPFLWAASGGALDWGREGIGCELEFDALTDLVAAGEDHVMAADCGGLFGAAW
jgi:hypothetical protein